MSILEKVKSWSGVIALLDLVWTVITYFLDRKRAAAKTSEETEAKKPRRPRYMLALFVFIIMAMIFVGTLGAMYLNRPSEQGIMTSQFITPQHTENPETLDIYTADQWYSAKNGCRRISLGQSISVHYFYESVYSNVVCFSMPDEGEAFFSFAHVVSDENKTGDGWRAVHIAVFPGQQGHNSRPVRAIIGGQQAA